MSDDFFSDDYDDQPDSQDTSQNSGPKGLREWGERQKARADELEARLAAIEEDSRKAKLADALKGTGVQNPDALGDYAKLIEPDKAGDFVSAVKAALGLADDSAPQGVSADDVAAVAAVSGEPSGTAPVTTGDAAASLGSITDEAEFWAKIRGN